MNEYFSHDYRARYDDKLISLTMKHGLAGIGAFWCIVEMCYESGGFVERSQYERIAFELRTDAKFIQSVVEDFKLFKFKGEKFYSQTALERLKKRIEKSEKARSSVAARWAKKEENKSNTNVSQTKSESNTNKEKKRKEKQNKENDSFIPLALSQEEQTNSTSFITENQKTKEKTCAKKESRFIIPPSLEMVTAYCKERQNNVSPSRFIDHYTAKNWFIGKQKMCDWQAAIRTWESDNPTSQTKKYGKL